ncbi:MAG: glycosyl transferase [Coxiella sp. (in: Bacteria)]|nr:MAG: glycosyl transferase [Coxiella sp. (in: g-proteobacteria)]
MLSPTASVKPRLLIVVTALDMGGTEKHLLAVLPHLRVRYDIFIYAMLHAGALHEQFNQAGIPVFYTRVDSCRRRSVFSSLTHRFVAVIKFTRHLLRHDYEAIHFFLPAAYTMGGCIATLLRRQPLLMSRRSQNDYQEKHPIAAKIEYFLHKKMRCVMANSTKVAEQLGEEGVTPSQLRLIHNGVDLAQFGARTVSENDRLVFAIVANLYTYKGHADLLQALALIKDRLPDDWIILCIGRDAGALSNLRVLAQQLSLDQHIQFLGECTNVSEILQTVDVGVLCSHEEGFSNAILEFMASSVPMVVTNVGGNAEAVMDQVCGYVVPARDPGALGEALLTLALNKEIRRQFGAAARQRVETQFSLGACIEQYDVLYQSILSEEASCAAL